MMYTRTGNGQEAEIKYKDEDSLLSWNFLILQSHLHTVTMQTLLLHHCKDFAWRYLSSLKPTSNFNRGYTEWKCFKI